MLFASVPSHAATAYVSWTAQEIAESFEAAYPSWPGYADGLVDFFVRPDDPVAANWRIDGLTPPNHWSGEVSDGDGGNFVPTVTDGWAHWNISSPLQRYYLTTVRHPLVEPGADPQPLLTYLNENGRFTIRFDGVEPSELGAIRFVFYAYGDMFEAPLTGSGPWTVASKGAFYGAFTLDGNVMTPEPASWALIAGGLGALAVIRRRRRAGSRI